MYHVYNRGVDKRVVFSDKVDFHRFHHCLSLFNATEPVVSVFSSSFRDQQSKVTDALVDIHAYCLLDNHFHLLLSQRVDGGISEYLKRLAGGYTGYFNDRHERSGSLFQGTFKRVHVATNEQLRYLAAYVNRNDRVHRSRGYFLSSYSVYAGERDESFLETTLLTDCFGSRQQLQKETSQLVDEIARRRCGGGDYQKGLFLE